MVRLLVALVVGVAQFCHAGTEPQAGRPGGRLVTPRSSHTATLLADGRVLLAAGEIDVSPYTINNAELYDPATNTWTATGSLNDARNSHLAVLLPDGRVLVTAGQSHSGAIYLTSAELYNPATGLWTFTGSMSTPHYLSDAVLLPNGKVLVAGGRIAVETDTAELYDPATGTWGPTGSLLQPRSNYHATLLTNGKVLVAGGSSQTGLVAETEIYDPATGAWSNSGTLNIPRFNNTQTRLADGSVLIAGGQVYHGSDARFIRTSERYDPISGLWAEAGGMKFGRVDFTANLLPNGRIFAVGASRSQSGLGASIEEYAPATGRWGIPAISLATDRSGHTTTTLLNGSVIVAGGVDTSFVLAPNAELFGSRP